MAAKRRKKSAEEASQKRPSVLPGIPRDRAATPPARAKALTADEPPPSSSRVVEHAIRNFVRYASACSDEKGEAQVFCDRLFRAFGWDGYKEAGAVLENRVKMEDGRTRFADLVWKPRVLIEMKKRGEKLSRHYAQVMQYWLRLTPNRPRYVILCNFDDVWIYDFNTQLDEPVDLLKMDELPARYTALNFMFPEDAAPLFRNNRAAVTDVAAMKVGQLFRALVARGEERERAQRFTLQCVVAMFSEDTGLLPRGLFTQLVHECMKGASSYDLFGGLFAQMNRVDRARAGRFKDVRYFNGGIFAKVEHIELNEAELLMLNEACDEDWSRINPAIFGTLFQESMESKEQHQRGAHYTPEAEIMRVVLPTIVQPFQTRIRRATSVKDLLALREELSKVRVLDPSCGSGNFLYVAYREMKRLELSIIERITEEWKEASRLKAGGATTVQIKQFHGIDNDRFAVELAKVTLVLAKKLAYDEANAAQEGLFDKPLPLENLDEIIRCDDALFCTWPESDVIIGNPPYQSKNKAQQEFSPKYMADVRAKYPGVPGHADYCVYWFRRAHDELPEHGHAGLVGTNTIRQTNSRIGGLDYITSHGGTIIDAVSTQVWPGRAVIHVSIVNWTKGDVEGKKPLAFQEGDDVESPWRVTFLDHIPATLSDQFDVSKALKLETNATSTCCEQGQTPGHEAFVISREEALAYLRSSPKSRDVMFAYLTGDEMLSNIDDDEWRYVIDFEQLDQLAARAHKALFERIHKYVLPAREKAAAKETQRNAEILATDASARVNRHHANFLKKWWRLSYARDDLLTRLSKLHRYVACSRVTRRPIFEFVNAAVHPSDALTVFPLSDDYSFGILQSNLHWAWFRERCSSLKGDPRYTSSTVFDSFTWPQTPNENTVAAVAKAAAALRVGRRRLLGESAPSLRDLYATLEDPGDNPLRDLHSDLDDAVRAVYKMSKRDNPLEFLMNLNTDCASREKAGKPIVGPGLPPGIEPPMQSVDCVSPPKL